MSDRSPSPRPWWRPSWQALVVLGVALAVRAIYLAEIAASPSFRVPIVDAATYHGLAVHLAAGDGVHAGFFWQGIFYPTWLGGVYTLFGPSIVVAKALQLGIGAITCVLTFQLGRRLFGPRVGLGAGLIAAVYGPMFFFEADLVATGWITFFAVALLLLLARLAERPTLARGIAVGVVGALAVLTWSVFLPVVVVAAGVIALRHRALGGALAVALAFATIAAPAALWTRAETGTLTILPSSGGLNLYLGNNPERARTMAARPWSEEWRAIRALPGPSATDDTYARSSFYTGLVVDYVRRDPAGFAAGLAHKALLFFGSVEIPRNEDAYVFRTWSHVLSLTMWHVGGFGFPFVLLLPLAVIGLVVERRRVGVGLWTFVLLYPAGVVLVFVSGRYRVPMVPALAVLAAVGARALWAWGRARAWRPLALASAGALALVAVGSIRLDPEVGPTNFHAELYRMVGVEAYRDNRVRDAIGPLEHALEIDPDYVDAHVDLARALAVSGRPDLARAHFARALALRPQSTRIGKELAALP